MDATPALFAGYFTASLNGVQLLFEGEPENFDRWLILLLLRQCREGHHPDLVYIHTGVLRIRNRASNVVIAVEILRLLVSAGMYTHDY